MDDIHEELGVQHTDGQQNTGNHKQPDAPENAGADKFGGTRTGAGNVEPPHTEQAVTNIEKGTDVDKVADREEQLDDSVSVNGPTERTAERDEHGRM